MPLPPSGTHRSLLPGLQDITAHVDFTAIASKAVLAAGLDFLGYTTQAAFLLNCGLAELMARVPADDLRYLPQAQAAQKLLSPAEMGELFKVIALGKGLGDACSASLKATGAML